MEAARVALGLRWRSELGPQQLANVLPQFLSRALKRIRPIYPAGTTVTESGVISREFHASEVFGRTRTMPHSQVLERDKDHYRPV